MTPGQQHIVGRAAAARPGERSGGFGQAADSGQTAGSGQAAGSRQAADSGQRVEPAHHIGDLGTPVSLEPSARTPHLSGLARLRGLADRTLPEQLQACEAPRGEADRVDRGREAGRPPVVHENVHYPRLGSPEHRVGLPPLGPKQPLLVRLLKLRALRPTAWQRVAVGDLPILGAVILTLGDLATAWTLLVLPLAVLAVVKFHDIIEARLRAVE